MKFALFTVAVLLFAGCADKNAAETPQQIEGPEVEVDEEHGAIRGVVIDAGYSPVEGARVTFTYEGVLMEALTDANGEFAFSKILPGIYLVEASKVQYETSQATAEVVANDANPPLTSILMKRLVMQDPFITAVSKQGFFNCAYNFFVSSTCVNDYTRLAGAVCPGGCAPELSSLLDTREFVMVVEEGWQSMIFEMTWEPSLAGTGDAMGMTVSYESRPSTSHFWLSASHQDPFLDRLDINVTHPSENIPSDTREDIPWDGMDDMFVFMAAGEGEVSLQQEFELFVHFYYWAPAPENWSFLAGDPKPW